MPVYVYQVANADGTDGEVFEIEQSASDAALTAHPLTGLPVRRVLQPAAIAGPHNERHVRAKLHDSTELSRLGFARYERDKPTGRYHKIAGGNADAPDVLGH